MTFLLIPLMSLSARAAGDRWFGQTKVWGVLFALPFAYANYLLFGVWWLSIFGFIVSFMAYETGHGTFYGMQGYHDHNRPDPNEPRKQKLEYIIEPIFNLFNIDKHKPSYSWACMAAKGFFIGLPLGWYALALAVLWPSAYWLGFRREKHGAVAEYLSGMAAGVVVVMAVI